MNDLSPSKFRVRGVFRGLVARAARPLAKRNIRPDSITYVAVLMSVIAFLLLSTTRIQPLYGLFVFIVGFLDGVDGFVARERGMTSNAGALTDSYLDKVSEVVMLLSIAVTYESSIMFGVSVPIWVLLCIAGWLMTSYSRSRAESLGVTDLDIGLGARSERLLILVIFSLLSFLLWGLLIVTLLGIFTAAYRFYHYKQALLRVSIEQEDHHT